MNRNTVIALALVSTLSLATAAARADLTFDLRAVSGSQIIIHGPKSVAVNQDSVGGWVDFELWALVTGSNASVTDDGLQNFAGNMLSTHIGRGAAAGSMINSGEIAPGVRRGIVTPFDDDGYQHGTLQNLDSDPDFEIGGTDPTNARNKIAGRDNAPVMGSPGSEVANFLLYRFTLPLESIPAQDPGDMTAVHFERSIVPLHHQWREDGVHYSAVLVRPNKVFVNEAVLIHTVPEPGTWALALAGLIGISWLAKCRND